MRAANTVWRITWGDYDFALDRQTLTYDLTETQTGTVWASGLSVGWMELEDRATGERVQHDFAGAKLVSVAEKSSAQGKRLLLGLDLLGVPIDLYFICSQREIQLTVEANRDTREYLVQDVGLLPGLVSVPDNNASYIVLPHHDGMICQIPYFRKPHVLPVWEPVNGLTMPFVGARRNVDQQSSAIALITDSAYAQFAASPWNENSAKVDLQFRRDPERRRLEAKIIVLPQGNYVDVALAYRNRIVVEKNHVTLRRKMRDNPSLAEAFSGDEFDFKCVPALDFQAHLPQSAHVSRWEYQERVLRTIETLHKEGWAVSFSRFADWSAIAIDFQTSIRLSIPNVTPVPLSSVVYHDSIIMPHGLRPWLHLNFLDALIACSPPWLPIEGEYSDRCQFVLCSLYKLTFPAFLSVHNFITADQSVEEATYSDKTQVVVNKSNSIAFEREDIHLPRLGFYVRHAQMEAHYALRVGEQVFETPAWRIRRARDGKRLEESVDVLVQEFPV